MLHFQYLENRLEKMYVHAPHTVHAMADLRIAAGRLGDGVSVQLHLEIRSMRASGLCPCNA
jgi:hypothetical protein